MIRLLDDLKYIVKKISENSYDRGLSYMLADEKNKEKLTNIYDIYEKNLLEEFNQIVIEIENLFNNYELGYKKSIR